MTPDSQWITKSLSDLKWIKQVNMDMDQNKEVKKEFSKMKN